MKITKDLFLNLSFFFLGLLLGSAATFFSYFIFKIIEAALS